MRPPPRSTLFPYPTLFRSSGSVRCGAGRIGQTVGILQVLFHRRQLTLLSLCLPLLKPRPTTEGDRKSTRLNSSHANISYAVFCLKKTKAVMPVQQYLTPHL